MSWRVREDPDGGRGFVVSGRTGVRHTAEMLGRATRKPRVLVTYAGRPVEVLDVARWEWTRLSPDPEAQDVPGCAEEPQPDSETMPAAPLPGGPVTWANVDVCGLRSWVEGCFYLGQDRRVRVRIAESSFDLDPARRMSPEELYKAQRHDSVLWLAAMRESHGPAWEGIVDGDALLAAVRALECDREPVVWVLRLEVVPGGLRVSSRGPSARKVIIPATTQEEASHDHPPG